MGEEREPRQATFGSDGELDTDRDPDASTENDFGDPTEANETDGGYNRYAVSSLLQKAVRRSDEEVAAWAAWELARSGYAWNLWDRLNLYVVEDLRAGHQVALTIERYEELAHTHRHMHTHIHAHKRSHTHTHTHTGAALPVRGRAAVP